MKKRNVFVVAVLVLSLAMVGYAQASEVGAGFNVNCVGATGYGWVPAHTSFIWSVTLNDPAFEGGFKTWDGWVSGGETGAPFEVVIEWGIAPTLGASSYVWTVWAEDGSYCNYGEGCLECFQACTPGYWKNLRKHEDEWLVAGYAPADSFAAVFGVDLGYATLGDAVEGKGGGDGKLARFAVAALLSGAHPDVAFSLTLDQVFALVSARDADALAGQFGDERICPLD